MKGGYGLSIPTDRTDGIGRFRFVDDQKNCISLRGLRKIFRRYRCEGGLRVVDPYGSYGWNRSFSIRRRSENCISLRGPTKS